MPTTFNFSVNATGIPGESADFYWSVFEPDSGWRAPDDELVHERLFTMTITGAGMGSFAGSFILFNDRDGYVKGVDNTSGEQAADPVFVLIESFGGGNLLQSNSVSVVGTPYTQPTGTTTGTFTVTASLTGPATLNRHDPAAYGLYTATITVTGTPGTTIQNLRWSVIEPDSGTSAPDDWLVERRGFNVTIGPGGTTVITKQFIMFSAWNGNVGGVDDWSGEGSPDPIYVLVEKSDGTDVAQSTGITIVA